jgi:hypothetical protein
VKGKGCQGLRKDESNSYASYYRNKPRTKTEMTKEIGGGRRKV